MRRTRVPQPCRQARMQGLQPIHRAVFGPGSGPSGGNWSKENGNYRRDRSYSRPARRSRAALLQRETLQAHGPRPAAASSVGFVARFAYEHRPEVPRSRGCFPHAPASQLARAKERPPHADEHAREILSIGTAFGSCDFSGGKSQEGVGLPGLLLGVTLRRTRGGRYEHALLNPVVDVAPPYAVASERQQPDHKRGRIPDHDERHPFPESSLVQSPNADQPRHCHAERQIEADIGEANCRRISQRNGQTPWQSLCESKAHMSPRTHVPHHRHPTEPLAEKRTRRVIVWYGLHRIGKQFDLQALLRDQASNQKIIGGPVFNGFVSAKFSKVRAGCDNGGPQGELNTIQLPGNQDSRIEIGIHAGGLEMLRESFVLGGNVETGYSADFGIAQRSHNSTQIVWLDANVAVVDYQDFVARFIHQPDQLGYFVVNGLASRTIQHADSPLREIAHQLLKNRHRCVIFIAHAENQLVVRIILPAVARKILVGFRI